MNMRSGQKMIEQPPKQVFESVVLVLRSTESLLESLTDEMPVPGILAVVRVPPFAFCVTRNPLPPILYPIPDLLIVTRAGPSFFCFSNS